MRTKRYCITNLLTILTVALFAFCSNAVEQWGVEEIVLKGPAASNPYRDVTWSATFSQGEKHIVVPGFWDGGVTYRARFSPPSPGEWRFETKSDKIELNGKSGVLTVTAPTAGNHGPVEVFDEYYLRYADGSPYHEYGTTCYAWVHQTQALQEQTLKTLATSPFNKIRFCVFPKSYVYNTNEPELFAFKKGEDGKFDFNQPDPTFWRHFEQRILDLQRLGLQADIILWHPYDRWGFSEMSKEQDDRYLRYCIARFSAYRNVWWSLANEYDFMTNVPKGHRGNKQWDDWDRFFSILQKEDPNHRLRGIHNGAKWYDHAKDWVTHASIQTSDMNSGIRFRTQYHKPVVYDECKYEGNIPIGWGNLTGRQMTQRFWLGTMSGCYVGHGETYKDPQDVLWWSKGGVLHGESPKRIQWLKDFMAKAPPFEELEPLGNEKAAFVLAKPGEYYLLYCLPGRSQSIQLTGSTPYKVDAIDPWEMTESAVGTAQPGEFKTAAPKGDIVYRFIPYVAGEKMRPEARINASASSGVAPLTVHFDSAGARHAQWDFGDGAGALETEATHTFEKSGLYLVTMTVTDADGATARNQISIAVDRKFTGPVVMAGSTNTEMPGFKLYGTTKRDEDGGLLFSDGAPWGRAETEQIPEDLRGVRSFTVLGWIKPETLQTGSGGNRIVFCLNGDRAGIDLVSLEDGRMRLAVNQWPDDVQNDSRPGKLKVGKWSFFAVSYDATALADNVKWYFSEPSERPETSSIALDRKTSYNAGPVDSDIGPLAIGNFNRTMEGYGWDRQFRGEIRGLKIFSSRANERGALTITEINSQEPISSNSTAPQ